jgi:hypothetical protein
MLAITSAVVVTLLLRPYEPDEEHELGRDEAAPHFDFVVGEDDELTRVRR